MFARFDFLRDRMVNYTKPVKKHTVAFFQNTHSSYFKEPASAQIASVLLYPTFTLTKRINIPYIVVKRYG